MNPKNFFAELKRRNVYKEGDLVWEFACARQVDAVPLAKNTRDSNAIPHAPNLRAN
jgi:hypothetical protein